MVEFYKKRLKNGLIVIFEKRNLPVVSVSSSVKFGSAFESEETKGIAHFIEHLVFKGTKTRSQKEIAEEIERKGGFLNAYTGEEVTSYWSKLPSRHFLTGISIASDLTLNPKFDDAEFEKEKSVIREEIKMRHDNPSYFVYDKIKEMMYKKPFGLSAGGSEETLRKMNRQQIAKLFNSVYSTDSMIMCIVGKADFGDICKQAEKIYPPTKRKAIKYAPVKRNLEKFEKRAGIDQAHFIFGFHAPTLKEKERYAYETAGTYLFGGMSSKLWQEIREKRGLAYFIRGGFDFGAEYGLGTIYIGTLKEKLKTVRGIIAKEIKNLRDLRQKDFEECKEQLIGTIKVNEEDSSNVMNSLLLEEVGGNAEEYYKYEERIKAVKLAEVRKLWKLRNFSSFSLIPE
jgi:predicted Zn-dependent peptidase